MTYDFSQEDNKIIEGVGIRGLLIGVLLILIAVVGIVKDVIATEGYTTLFILTTVQNGMAVLIAIAFILPFFDYRNIAKTEGKDIKEFMDGIRKMTLGFMIIIVATLATVATEVIRLFVGP